jgi:hypothetical protein
VFPPLASLVEDRVSVSGVLLVRLRFVEEEGLPDVMADAIVKTQYWVATHRMTYRVGHKKERSDDPPWGAWEPCCAVQTRI